MFELLAITIGIAVGAGLASARSWAAGAALIATGVAGALAAFALSGEIRLDLGFLAWDLGQVAAAAAIAHSVVRRALARRAE